MRLVMKFGGGLLKSGTNIRESAQLVRGQVEKGHLVVAVTSALGGVTDELVRSMQRLSATREDRQRLIGEFCSAMLEKHLRAARESARDLDGSHIRTELEGLVKRLKERLMLLPPDPEPRKRDEVVAMGEMLSAPIFASTLSSLGVPSRSLTGGEAGLVTDSNFERARPNMEICRRRIPRVMAGLLDEGITPVVTGFIGEDTSGALTTLGRGGSDYTASIIGACLPADEIWILKDVGGIMTANPRIVRDARTIPLLSYAEAAELAYFGAKVLHPRTMAPAMEAQIPIRVKDASQPGEEGTLISSRTKTVPGSVKAVTSVDDVGLIAVSGAGMAGVPGVAARVFDALASGQVNVMMISQSSSETNITIVVPRGDIETCRRLLGVEFQRDDLVGDIRFEEDVSILSVVGSGMKGTPGVAARVFKSVAQAGVNVVMIAQGSSELNISFVVKRQDAARALASIHREFRLNLRSSE